MSDLEYEQSMRLAISMVSPEYQELFRDYVENGHMDPGLMAYCHTDDNARLAKEIADDAAMDAMFEGVEGPRSLDEFMRGSRELDFD